MPKTREAEEREWVYYLPWLVSHRPGHDGPTAESHQDSEPGRRDAKLAWTWGTQRLYKWALAWGALPYIQVSATCIHTPTLNGQLCLSKYCNSFFSTVLLLSIFPQILAHAGYNVYGVSVTEIAGGGDSLFAGCEGGGSLCRPMVGVHALR